MNVECVICQEHPRIPVRFTCFPCSRQDNDHRTCHSLLRTCMYCADRYLQLNDVPRDRPLSKRCLTCSSLVHPRSIYKADAYVKDYLLMSLDMGDYECPNSVFGCSFSGKQCDLDHHLKNSCDHRLMQCPGNGLSACGSYRMSDEIGHQRVCVRYKLCNICNEAVLRTDVQNHMMVQHQMIECPHCKEMHKEDKMEQHAKTCIHRRVPCGICSTTLPFCVMANHVASHIRSMTARLHKMENELVEKYRVVNDTADLQTSIKEMSDKIVQYQQLIHKIRLTVKFNAVGIDI